MWARDATGRLCRRAETVAVADTDNGAMPQALQLELVLAAIFRWDKLLVAGRWTSPHPRARRKFYERAAVQPRITYRIAHFYIN